MLGRVLRHSTDNSVPRTRKNDGSLTGEVAFALLIQRNILHQGDSPRELYDCMKLAMKD